LEELCGWNIFRQSTGVPMMKPNTHQTMVPEAKPESKHDTRDNVESLPAPRLQAFGDNIWIADGPEVLDMGILFTTRMAVNKLSDGSIWVESPVPMPFETLKRVTEMGPVRYLVAATPRHVWRLDGWHTLFPEAQLWVSRPTPFTLKKGNLPITGILGDGPDPGWAQDLDQLAFKGSPFIEEVLFFHKESRTVILDDLLQIHQNKQDRPFRNALMKIEGVTAPYGGVGLELRLVFFQRQLARQSLERLLSWDFDKLIIAHGGCINKDAMPFVERAFRWLAR
jgi:hypothetical protein